MLAIIFLIVFFIVFNTLILGMAVELSLPVTRYPRVMKFFFFLPPMAILYYFGVIVAFSISETGKFFIDHYKKISKNDPSN